MSLSQTHVRVPKPKPNPNLNSNRKQLSHTQLMASVILNLLSLRICSPYPASPTRPRTAAAAAVMAAAVEAGAAAHQAR